MSCEVGLCNDSLAACLSSVRACRYGARAVINLATGGAPFSSLYALQVTGSWLREAQTWIRQDCLPVKSYRRGRPSPLNAFFKKLIFFEKKRGGGRGTRE